MNVSLYQAAAALGANSRWQEVISENLAASSIPGYKRQELSFSQIAARTPEAQPVLHTTTATNFSQGQLKPTGVHTDVAIEGRGFIPVQLPDGTTAYTRDGEFQINSVGQLVTKQGHLVLGDGGPIQIDMNNRAPISIAPTGEVSQGSDTKGTIKLHDFENPELLSPIGNGHFLARNPALKPLEPLESRLRQGFVETANTSPAAEMAHLISAMRIYEANQRVIQVQDERMARAISELGKPS